MRIVLHSVMQFDQMRVLFKLPGVRRSGSPTHFRDTPLSRTEHPKVRERSGQEIRTMLFEFPARCLSGKTFRLNLNFKCLSYLGGVADTHLTRNVRVTGDAGGIDPEHTGLQQAGMKSAASYGD